MDAILTSIAVVAVAEIGDKTQLLAIVLAARFRRPVPIILGILAATLLNHAAAAGGGIPHLPMAGRPDIPDRRRRRLHRDGGLGIDSGQG
jgi:putative Ca2+/H+ antiporter (TMEM165/GDT1 family)